MLCALAGSGKLMGREGCLSAAAVTHVMSREPSPDRLAVAAAASGGTPPPLPGAASPGTTAAAPADRPFLGIAMTLLAMAVFSGMDATSKLLAATHHPVQVAWARYLVILLLLAPVVAAGRGRALRT